MNSYELIEALIQNNMKPFIGVPCSLLKNAINFLNHNYPDLYVTANNEGEALAIATGMSLANNRPVVMMQNSGIGNMINPFVSLNEIYKIPITFINVLFHLNPIKFPWCKVFVFL